METTGQEKEHQMQTWIIRTTEQLDNDDNDPIGFAVDEETYNHAEPFDIDDWKHSAEEIIDIERDDNGTLTRLIVQAFDQDYDRSSETWYPIVRTRDIERQEVTH
jgi:hypothetical protein